MDRLDIDTPSPLARYHRVLQAVSGRVTGLNLAELVKVTGLPRSSTHRLAKALCGVGYLTDTSGQYELGPAFRELLQRSLMADNRLQAFQPALQFLVSELKETAFFARFVDGTVDLAHAVTPTQVERSYIFPGTGERPLDTCSSSKAILAWKDERVVQALYESGYLPLDDASSLRGFIDTLQQVHRDGYAICDGEIDAGAFSLACPVFVGPMLGLFSIGVVGPSARMKKIELSHLVKVVQEAAFMASSCLLEDA